MAIFKSIRKEGQVNSKLEIGKKVPDFELVDDNGSTFRLFDHFDSNYVIIYFYPKDNTLVCTQQACAFRDEHELFCDLDAVVIGISSDSPETHHRFKEKNNLPFILLSDQNNTVRDLYGIKNDFLGLIPGRVSLIIDKNANLLTLIDSQLNAKLHVEESLKSLRKLT